MTTYSIAQGISETSKNGNFSMILMCSIAPIPIAKKNTIQKYAGSNIMFNTSKAIMPFKKYLKSMYSLPSVCNQNYPTANLSYHTVNILTIRTLCNILYFYAKLPNYA